MAKHRGTDMLRRLALFLLLLLPLAVAGRRSPWFNGWCTRIVDHAAGRSVTLILGTFQAAGDADWTEMYAAALVAEDGRPLRTEQAFPDPSSVAIAQRGKRLRRLPARDRARFEWSSELGTVSVNGSQTDVDLTFPSGLRVSAALSGRVPWDSLRPDRAGPEGWTGSLPGPLLPTHYFVHSFGSEASYRVGAASGSGIAHQEANYGRRFPHTYLWAQGTSEDGLSQFVLTGGHFTIAGITTRQFIVALRTPETSWNFRTIDLDAIDGDANGCSGTLALSARSRDGRRRLEVMIHAAPDSFSERIFTPTEGGFNDDPGGSESHTAVAVLRAHHGHAEVEEVRMPRAALEFAGDYICSSTPAGSAAAPAAFVPLPSASHFSSLGSSGRLRTLAGRSAGQRSSAARGPGVARSAVGSWLAVAAASALCMAVTRAGQRRRKRRTLQEGIADFYDSSSGIWVGIWGEHMHHGYYDDAKWRSLEEHKAAQVRMIEEALTWAGMPEPGQPGAPGAILDVGCGVGGSSRFLQKRYGAKQVRGITLSPKQCAMAKRFSEESGQGSTCSFSVTDALHMPFPDNSFDFIWSMESGEHMPDKPRFLSEMQRVCRPGGRILLVTWVHRDLQPGEQLAENERRLLWRINKAYHLPEWCSIADYASIAEKDLGMKQIRTADWTENIKPFWMAVIITALQPRGWLALARGGMETLRGALVMPLMDRGYRTGTIKFGLMTAVKAPEAGDA